MATLSSGLRLETLGERIRTLRKNRGLSLGDLSASADVSRSMLSAVERGEKVPSILVLDQIATGLGSSIARLLGEERTDRVRVIPRNDQNVVVDPSGWERRILSPVLANVEFEFMRTSIGPGVNAGAFRPHNPGSREYVAIERGTLELTVDGVSHLLSAGDSIYFAGDCVHEFENPDARRPCEYYLAMDVSGHPEQLMHRPATTRRQARRNRGT
jgi:transcriptional regulator with XRE-family HTH domain